MHYVKYAHHLIVYRIKRTFTSFHPLNINSLSSHVDKQSESTDMNMIFGIIDISTN